MSKKLLPLLIFASAFITLQAQTNVNSADSSVLVLQKKATEWAASLQLNDQAKESRVAKTILTHLTFISDWNKNHPYTMIPEGCNPRTGDKLSILDRQMIMDSSRPDSIHRSLMARLRKELTEEQVEKILDKYTIGKVAFTLNAYKVIVPDLTADEEQFILANLKKAREIAVDYKSMKEISAIFEIYKTKNEQFLIGNGRNWRALHKAFTESVKAKKAAGHNDKPAESK